MQYITDDDKERLQNELNERVGRRKTITKRIEEARALGDLKENAEYHAAREDQGMNEAKIRQLEHKLATAVVTDTSSVPDDMVFLGANVILKDTTTGAESEYRLVGEASGSQDDDVIEVTPESPLGEALMKTRLGETVKVDLRRGPKRFEIISISR